VFTINIYFTHSSVYQFPTCAVRTKYYLQLLLLAILKPRKLSHY